MLCHPLINVARAGGEASHRRASLLLTVVSPYPVAALLPVRCAIQVHAFCGNY